jgi:hypothetical protein
MASITLKPSISRLLKSITNLQQLKPVKGAVRASALHIEGEMKKYPPKTAANQSGPYPKRWYERGYGPRWAKAGGGVGGRPTSETLGRKWTIAITNQGLSAQVGNNVKYGPYVQGSEGDKKQTITHRDNGWLTDQDVIDNEGQYVNDLIAEAVEDALERL